uniref:Uncharacterized protein n=1 Tax=Acropora millepora TaxID=45264 RepID=G8HTB7_ACRMI|nr:hypothetical protein A020-G3 [Acropora millepora]
MQKLVLGAFVALACVCLIQANSSSSVVNGGMDPTTVTHMPDPTTSSDHHMPASSSSAGGHENKGEQTEAPTSGAAGTAKAIAGVLAPIFLFVLL